MLTVVSLFLAFIYAQVAPHESVVPNMTKEHEVRAVSVAPDGSVNKNVHNSWLDGGVCL